MAEKSTSLTGADATKPRLQHMAALPRDFNILSNRYVEDHDAKVSLEREVQRRSAALKYWETHDYEPLLGKYVDPEKEAKFQVGVASSRRAAPPRAGRDAGGGDGRGSDWPRARTPPAPSPTRLAPLPRRRRSRPTRRGSR